MPNATIDKKSTATKGGTHLNSNNYNTSCTRSATAKNLIIGGHPEDTMTLSTARIEIHPDYQRDMESRKSQFNRVVREWDPDKARHLKVAKIGGHYYCYDGQLTMRAAEKVYEGNIDMTCDVMYGLTLAEMGILFSHQDDNKVNVSKSDKLRVGANSGDEEAILFRDLNEEFGFSTDKAIYRTKDLIFIKATDNLWKEFKRCSTAQYKALLRTMHAFDGQENQTHNGIICGLGLFIRTYDGEYDEERLMRALNKDGAVKIIRDARNDIIDPRGAKRFARPILASYNKGLRKNRLADKLN